MRYNFLKLLILAFVTVSIGCEEEEVHPNINTVSVTPISASSFTVVGNFSNVGSIPVIEYGFVYSRYDNPLIEGGNKVVMGGKPVNGDYSATIGISGFDPYYSSNDPIFVRAFIINDRGTAYGSIKRVQLPQLNVTLVSPLTAAPGEMITITGSNFNTNPALNSVKFNNTPAIVKSAESTKLVVEVPENISCDYYCYDSYVDVNVATGSQIVVASQYFVVKPGITNFTPTTGSFGTRVSISGSFRIINNYGYNGYSVQVGGQNAEISSITQNVISFIIPSTVSVTSPEISLIYAGSTYAVGTFSMQAPVISSISCVNSYAGAPVTIYGSGFHPSYYSGYNKVKVGGVQASLVSGSVTQITFLTPSNLSVGNYSIEVNNGLSSTTHNQNLVIFDWSTSGVSVDNALRGTTVRINGSFPSCEYYPEIILGSWNMSVVGKTENYIDFQVYNWMSAGTHQLKLSIGNKSTTVLQSFLVK